MSFSCGPDLVCLLMDESMITGESREVSKRPGDAVVAGTVAEGGSFRVQVKAVGGQTALSGIMRLVAAARFVVDVQRYVFFYPLAIHLATSGAKAP